MRRAWMGPALATLAMAACGPSPQPETPAKTPVPLPKEAVSGAAPEPAAKAARDALTGPHGEKARLEGRRVVITSGAGAEQVVAAAELHPAPGDRALLGIAPMALLYLDDGTLLVGMGDGTVTALDGGGRRRWSLGFRGAIEALVPAGEGTVAVTTERGTMALLKGDGTLLWERQLTAEHLSEAVVAKDGTLLAVSRRGVFAVSPQGQPVFSHASHLLGGSCQRSSRNCNDDEPPEISIEGDEVQAGGLVRFRLGDAHPAVPSLTPRFPLTFRRVLEGTVVSLQPEGSSGVLALVTKRKERSDYEWDTDDRYEIVRIEGDGTKRFPVPHEASRKEVFEKGTRAVKAALFIDGLVAGPNGKPWVLGRRFSPDRTTSGDGLLGTFGGAGQILELSGAKVTERSDLFKVFFDHWLSFPIAAVKEGTAKHFCFGNESPTCVVYDGSGAGFRQITPPGQVRSAHAIGGGLWILTVNGKVFRLEEDGKTFRAVTQPDQTEIRAVAGASEKDVWAFFRQWYAALRFDGTGWKEVAVPGPIEGLSARAADDVWGGRAHWDGKAWSIVHGAPAAKAVLARGKDDVWLGADHGLWHGTAPGPSVVELPEAAQADRGAIAGAAVWTPGAPDTGVVATRVTVEIPNDTTVTAAKNVSAAPDGAVWLQTWDWLVEVDERGKGKKLRRAGMDTFGRAVHAEGKGRGVLLHRDEGRGMDRRDEVRAIDGSATGVDGVQLDHHDAVAVHGEAGGSVWVVGAPPVFAPGSRWYYEARGVRDGGAAAWEEFGAHALVRAGRGAGLQPVLGLPSAAWCDVAATSDGGAWFAGALSEGPAGEGILFHAKGKLGREATARYRAGAALLSVSAVGPEEAWGVGAAGTVIHVKGGSVTRLGLASGEWLRAVLATGPEEVWIGGDGGTLLRWDGRELRSVAHPLGANAAITGIAAGRGAVWAVGPSGLLKLTKRP